MLLKKIGGAAALTLLILRITGCAGNDLPVDAAPDDILSHAEQKLADEDYFDAVEVLEYFARSFPGSSRIPLVKLRTGDARYGLREYVVARSHYGTVVRDYPASDYVEEARYKIARCSYAAIYPHDRDQTETEEAIRLYEDFLRDYPQSRFRPEVEEAVAECRERLARREFEAGRFYEKQARRRSAKIQYQYVLDRFAETEWAPKACFRIGELYRSKDRWEEARQWYGRILREWPESAEAGVSRELLGTPGVAHADGGGGKS